MLEVDIRIEYDSLRIDSAFAIPTGTGAALMGPSGSGKSSILNVIAGFYQPQKNQVSFDGKALDLLKPAERPLTILFQEHNLFSHLNVWKNIAIGLNNKLKTDQQQQALIEDALTWVGLEGLQDRLPTTLSGGQKQRVALARCLARNKPLLLLDEPFVGLDQSRQQTMRELIKRMIKEKNMTLLLATHQQEDADQLCEKIIQVGAQANSDQLKNT